MHNRELIVLSCAIASMMVLVVYVGLVTVNPTHAQETFSIVGTWDNDNPSITDIYTIYPPTQPGGTSGAAQDVHSGITSPGTWEQATGTMNGRPYEYVWYWTFGPPAGNFIDYIHVIDNDHVSYINNYGNTGSNSRVNVNQPPTAAIQITPDPNLMIPPGVVEGTQITLDGSMSTDPEDETLQYAWTVTKSDSSSVAISNPSGAVTTCTPATPGTYSVHLTVTDPSGASDSETILLTVVPKIKVDLQFATAPGLGGAYRLDFAVTNLGADPVTVDAQATFWGLWQKYVGDPTRVSQKMATFKKITGVAPAGTTTILESEVIQAPPDQVKKCGEVQQILWNAKIDGKPYSTEDNTLPVVPSVRICTKL